MDLGGHSCDCLGEISLRQSKEIVRALINVALKYPFISHSELGRDIVNKDTVIATNVYAAGGTRNPIFEVNVNPNIQ